jgi:hypothetical protein
VSDQIELPGVLRARPRYEPPTIAQVPGPEQIARIRRSMAERRLQMLLNQAAAYLIIKAAGPGNGGG